MKLVIVESPYSGAIGRNTLYLRACLADCLRRGEAPFASHGLYTQPGVLSDTNATERSLGIEAGFAWRSVADLTVVYADLGISYGMLQGIRNASERGCPIEYRWLLPDDADLASRLFPRSSL